MQPRRIELAELKAQIVKKIGPERAKRYFYFLNRLLSQKLGKVEFDKLCFRLIGRENLPLHNQFIGSILKNACLAKTPPLIHEAGPAKSCGKNSPAIEDGREQNGLLQNSDASIWSNGAVLPLSPRKGRSAIRDRKLRDRPSPLGPNGKAYSASHQSAATEDSVVRTSLDNGNLSPCDYQRPVQHPHGIAEQSDVGRPKIKKPKDAHASLHMEGETEVGIVEDGEEVEQINHLLFSRSPLLAPLGIPFCSASIGGARKALPLSNTYDVISNLDSGYLPDTETLRKCMELIAASQGLGSVSMDCANALNGMLDVYLKRLIRSCVELVGPRSGLEPKKHPAQKQQIKGKLVNSMWLNNHLHMQRGGGPSEVMPENRTGCAISLHDFKVAMELNPQQLGEDWPLLLEKICLQAFEE